MTNTEYKTILDVVTGESVQVPLTKAELDYRLKEAEIELAEREAREAQQVKVDSAKAKLSALGLTDDEIKAILGV